MKEFHYSVERNVQICIALFKANGIKKIVASPGTTNIPFVGSAQSDSWFDIYSCVDERSAAYMACGMSAESGEPVILTCTGATASRNYMSGLTEAFYRRLPIIALTSTRALSSIGNLSAQVIDRTAVPNDIVKLSVFAPLGKNSRDEWDCKIKVSRALAALKRNGGGPVHINLETESNFDFSVEEIKGVRPLQYITPYDKFPNLPTARIAIYVASHADFSDELTTLVDKFCEQHNGVVYCDPTSNYHGNYGVMAPLLGCQDKYLSPACNMDLVIYMGDVSGAYESNCMLPKAKTLWRVSEDGEIRDPSHSLSKTFAMKEEVFFQKYVDDSSSEKCLDFYKECRRDYDHLYSLIPSDMPLSNIWMAKQMAKRIPEGCVMHFAILNSLRAWSFFDLPKTVRGYSNVGGFGIDGGISSLVGASLCHQDKLYFGIVGDLAFFYDMNVFGNRHIGNNIRILLVNNGRGMEFRNYTHPAFAFSNDSVDKFICAGGHYGNKSTSLVKDYVQNLGFEYMKASNKEDFSNQIEYFLSPLIGDKPIVFEIFTEQDDENTALHEIRNLEKSTDKMMQNMAKSVITKTVGAEGFNKLKSFIRKR